MKIAPSQFAASDRLDHNRICLLPKTCSPQSPKWLPLRCVIPRRTDPTSGRQLLTPRLLVLRDRQDQAQQGPCFARSKASRQISHRHQRARTSRSQTAGSGKHAVHPPRKLVRVAGNRRPPRIQAARAKPDPRLPPSPDPIRGLFNFLPPQPNHPQGRRRAQMARLRPHRRSNLQATQKLLPRSSNASKRQITGSRLRPSAIRPLRSRTTTTSEHPTSRQQSPNQASFRRIKAQRSQTAAIDCETVWTGGVMPAPLFLLVYFSFLTTAIANPKVMVGALAAVMIVKLLRNC